MKITLTIDDLEHSLKIPSFEQELAMSDLPKRSVSTISKDMRLARGRICGMQAWVRTYDVFKCPKEHGQEDDIVDDLIIKLYVR
jgi:hypothetical protein